VLPLESSGGSKYTMLACKILKEGEVWEACQTCVVACPDELLS